MARSHAENLAELAEASSTLGPAVPYDGQETAATARTAAPSAASSDASGQDSAGAGEAQGPSGDAGVPAAGGNGGRDHTPPPAPGGNDEPEQPQDGPAPAFTQRRHIREPRRALSEAVRRLTQAAYFRQRSDSPGAEAEVRTALAAYSRASLEQPLAFHDAVEELTTALRALGGAWPLQDVPKDAAQALSAAVGAAGELRDRWLATAASAAWEDLFEGTPRPALNSQGEAASQNTPARAETLAAGLPGMRLTELHAVIQESVVGWGADGQPNAASSPLTAFVRLMDDPAQWQAWQDELVASGRGLWLGGPRRAEALRDVERIDPAPEGIQISTNGTAQRPAMKAVIRWAEVPAWIALGLTEGRRGELLAAAAAMEGTAPGTPEHQEAGERLDRASLEVWKAMKADGTPIATALAAAWNRYTATPAQESDSLFDLPAAEPEGGAFPNAAQWTRSTNDVITTAWDAIAHPHWPATGQTQALIEAFAAFRSATTPHDTVYSSLLLKQAAENAGLAGTLPPQLQIIMAAFTRAAARHADRMAATAWGEQWARVFPSSIALWREDPFLMPRLGYPDPRGLSPTAQSPEPLGESEAGGFEPVATPDGQPAYSVDSAPGFRLMAEPSIWHGPAYTLHAPDDQVIATLVEEGGGWHTVMGDTLPGQSADQVTVLPTQRRGHGNLQAAVLNALRVWTLDGGQPNPWPATYLDRVSLLQAFADLRGFPDALRAAGRRAWPLSFENQPALARVLDGLEQLDTGDRNSPEDTRTQDQADALERLLPDLVSLRRHLDQSGQSSSDLHALVTVLAGHANEMPARLRATAATAPTQQTVPAPAAPAPQEEAAAEEAQQSPTPTDEAEAPIAEGAEWAPEFSVPATVTQLWNTAKARGWTMTRETQGTGYSQNLVVDVEAETDRGRWAFTLRWSIRGGRFSADKMRSQARWADGRAGKRGGTVHPTITEVLNVMNQYPAVAEATEPEAAATGTETVPGAAEQLTADTAVAAGETNETAQQAAESTESVALEADEPAAPQQSPNDATEIPGMPGYWWRMDPPREYDPYSDMARDDSERITVGLGADVIGYGNSPFRNKVNWTISVGGNYQPGGRTASGSAALIAERHQALQEATQQTGPRPAEQVWIWHETTAGGRTHVYGVQDSDSDVLAELRAHNFKKAPSHGAYVQASNVSPEQRAYQTGQFVRGMLRYNRSVAVHYTQDGGAPADPTLPELGLEQRQDLDRLTRTTGAGSGARSSSRSATTFSSPVTPLGGSPSPNCTPTTSAPDSTPSPTVRSWLCGAATT